MLRTKFNRRSTAHNNFMDTFLCNDCLEQFVNIHKKQKQIDNRCCSFESMSDPILNLEEYRRATKVR